MAVYLVGPVIVEDQARFQPYVAETAAPVHEYGGRVLDVTRATEVLEGSWPLGALTALMRFPSIEVLHAFWERPGNQRMKELRRRTARSHVAICVPLAEEPK